MKRKTAKRMIAALLILTLAALAACAKETPPETTAAPETAGTQPAETAGTEPATEETEPGTAAPAAEALTERCDAYAVTLPESWRDRYVCEAGETDLAFYHKQAREAGEGDALLFSLQLWEQPEDVDDVGPLGDGSYEVCMLTTPEAAYYVSRYDNVTAYFPEAYRQEAAAMMNALGDIKDRLSPEGGAELTFFDYGALEGEYVCEGKAGYDLRLRLYGASRNVLQAELLVTPERGGGQTVAAGTIRMLGGGGILFCDASDGAYFSCVVRPADGGTLRIESFGTAEWGRNGPYAFQPR